MKLLIKLALAALIANAAWRVGSVYASHYKFVDSVQAATQFRAGKSDDQVRQQIVDLASEFDIPVTEDTLKLRAAAYHTIVDGAYTRVIELAPGFKYSWPFTFHVDTFSNTP